MTFRNVENKKDSNFIIRIFFCSKKTEVEYIYINGGYRLKRIYEYFPEKIKELLEDNIGNDYGNLEEIRIRAKKPIILKLNDSEKIIKYIVSTEEIASTLQLVCENSIYSYQNQIANGYVTLDGGHRVGISGSCVVENGNVININYINSLNFRIARQVLNCSEYILKNILDNENSTIYNTLIVSAPGVGKTTLLRDIIRQISNGIKIIKFKGLNIGLVDERGEIASLYKGVPENEIGIRTDVIENVSKGTGMRMLIRSMAPKIIVADEIGNKDDIEAINYAMCSGCKGIFTAHGRYFEDLYINPFLKELINSQIVEKIIFLDEKEKGKARDVYVLNKKMMQYDKCAQEVINRKITGE